jgi:hypothetical protein
MTILATVRTIAVGRAESLQPEIKFDYDQLVSGPVKDEDVEVAVPEVWRSTLRAIVDSLVRRDAVLSIGLPSVDPLSEDDTQRCLQAIADYGDATLIPLPDEAWRTSVALWYGDRWKCLVDLWIEKEGRSDLVLDVDVFESAPDYRFCVHSVYVP